MDDNQSLNHSKWECQQYHVVFIPRYRRKALYAELRRHLGGIFRTLTQQKESAVEEGHLMSDHVHMLISISPKYSVAQVVGFIKGKSAIHIARTFMERKRNFVAGVRRPIRSANAAALSLACAGWLPPPRRHRPVH